MARDFLQSPGGATWRDLLRQTQPCVDQAGCLCGPWGDCLVEATVQEYTDANRGQAGQVIDFLTSCGHRGLQNAADKLERLTHRAMRAGGIHLQPVSAEDPQAWARMRSQAVAAAPVGHVRAGSSSSSRSSGSGSGSSGCRLDASSKELCRSAPPHARIGEVLERCIVDLPLEVVAEFAKQGSVVASCKCLKTSFHSTWLVEVSPPVTQEGKSYAKVIVQIVGSQVGDQPLSFHISGNQIVKAMRLARRAGVRVPDILFTGCCETTIGVLDFVAQEFITTETVEDKVNAPREDWNRIAQGVASKLSEHPIPPDDASPLHYFDSLEQFMQKMGDAVPGACAFIRQEMDRFVRGHSRSSPSQPTLLHQDVNSGNLLASPSAQGWQLDAIIDWESAVAAPAELSRRPLQEQWKVAMDFGNLAKGAWLAARMSEGTLPRCDLEALVENYAEAAQSLERRNFGPFGPWSDLVQKCRASGAGYRA
ncbi:unnamed protein product [Effrenium voratum]|uniref:Aminoglycoside phosphotransferase domain-containing protein n=1 Tax=Effrenium voratum TaxID=2562239 RepID=A0AA36MUW2_9DINO|nr:unnamed protein product [Effrenium voratum]